MRLWWLILFYPVIVFGQTETVVSGRIQDKETKEPLPFVSIGFKGLKGGITSNFEGRFKLTTNESADTLVVTFIGYKKYCTKIKRGEHQHLLVELTPMTHEMREAVVKPGVNPALRIVDAARRNKERYSQDGLNSYRYHSYSKMQVSLTNLSDRMKERKIFQPLKGLFDTANQMRNADGNHIIPIFMSETVSKYYYLKSIGKGKEVIEASSTHGVGVSDDTYLEDITGSELHHLNLNHDFIRFLNKDFISPLASEAHFFYIFTLRDSIEIDGMKCYEIRLDKRRKKDLAFEGTIWIADSFFALKRAALEIGPEANINFVKRLRIQQEITPTSSNPWITSKSRINIEFDRITKEGSGMVVMLYNNYSNIETNVRLEEKFFDYAIDHQEVEESKDAGYWAVNRSDSLSHLETGMMQQVDSINQLPVMRRYVDLGHFIVEGYKRWGPLEIGPYTSFISYNQVEGTRIRLGVKTNAMFSRKWIFNAYGAYGDKDREYKYRFGADYILNAKRWRVLSLKLRNDNDILGVTTSPISFLSNNGVFQFFNFFSNHARINRTQEVSAQYTGDLNSDWSVRLMLTHQWFCPQGNFRFNYLDYENGNPTLVNTYTNAEAGLELRYAFREVMVTRGHDRIRLERSKRPVIIFSYRRGVPGIAGSSFTYDKYGVVVSHHMNTGRLGTADWQIYGGAIVGNLPYPLLDVARGNESPIYSENNYNLLNFYEFISDRFVHLRYTQHFEGLILNRIPLIRELEWRNFAQVKVAYGSLTSRNELDNPAFATIPGKLSPVHSFKDGRPYVEAVYGLENIFKFFSLGVVQRFTYLKHPHARRVGLLVGVSVRF